MTPRKGPMFGAFDDPREAFEALVARGELPPSVMDDAASGRRTFLCALCRPEVKPSEFMRAYCARSGGCDEGIRAFPSSADDVQVWAGTPWQAAEALARETVARLAPWGVAPCEHILWIVERDPVWESILVEQIGWLPGPLRANAAGIPVSRMDNCDRFDETWRGSAGVASRLADKSRAIHAWAYTNVLAWDDPRPCPFVPLFDIVRLGCSIVDVTDGAVSMVTWGWS